MRKPISLVLIDDNSLTRKGVVTQIRAGSGFQVLAGSAEVEAALRTVGKVRPDMVLLNLRREGDDSLMLAGALHGQAPQSRVIILGLEPLHEDVASLIRAGVSGFLMANASFDTFLSTIHSVAQGIQVLPSELTRSLFAQLKRHRVRWRSKQMRGVEGLTNLERAVDDLIVQGLSNRAIAARLQFALHTVKSHVHKVLAKLAVNRRLEVAAFSRNGAGVPAL